MGRNVGEGAIAQEDVVVHPEALSHTVGTAYGRMTQNRTIHSVQRAREAILVATVQRCFAAGITDPDQIKAAKARALEALG